MCSVQAPADTVKAVDTVGAGDAFVGAFSRLFTAGLPMEEAMRRACLIASISVTRAGTQSAYPMADEVPPALLEGVCLDPLLYRISRPAHVVAAPFQGQRVYDALGHYFS